MYSVGTNNLSDTFTLLLLSCLIINISLSNILQRLTSYIITTHLVILKILARISQHISLKILAAFG